MAWVKLDDQFTDHPKIVAAGPQAGWLHVCAMCYASRYLTDGFIPINVIPRLMTGNTTKLVETLVAVGLWETAEGGYQIHDYLEYNPSRADTLAAREKDAKRQREHRDSRSGKYVSHDVCHTVTNTVTPDGVTTAPIPIPIPIPIHVVESTPAHEKNVVITPMQRQLMEMWDIPAANATQLAIISELVNKHGAALVSEAAKWAHTEGMQFGHALNSIRKALPNWNTRSNGNDRPGKANNGLDRLSKRASEYKIVTAAEVEAAKREAERDNEGSADGSSVPNLRISS